MLQGMTQKRNTEEEGPAPRGGGAAPYLGRAHPDADGSRLASPLSLTVGDVLGPGPL